MANQEYRVQPNYRQKFRPALVKDVMRKYMEDTLRGEKYDSDNVSKWSKEISHNIKSFLKSCNWPRYKYMVQVIIGENKGQGVKVASKQFWDEKNDSMSVHYYVNESLYCVAIAYGVYHY
eukprot:CAMPEP_0197037848 /NCGR_PEP_ID=MMETSP1384-20130603/14960_1 /TAXON_ID=29189 /ORGANISM="Ammonia sp." /LENGTH=119 /DNA_ID=CAMNT_0042468219 /DNA_START=33 /DNA_END=392 /DNA_ORIENTATION=-